MMFQWNGPIFVVGDLDEAGAKRFAFEKTPNGEEYLPVFSKKEDAIKYAAAKSRSADQIIRIEGKGIALSVLTALENIGLQQLNFNGTQMVDLDNALAFVRTWPD